LTTSERFAIAAIEVHGASRMTPDEVRAMLPAKVGGNIFKADLGDVARALRTNPWIRSASAHRVLPDTLVVRLWERTAVAVVQFGNALYLADETGHPFKQLDAPDEAGDLPILTGAIADAGVVVHTLDVLERWGASAHRPAVAAVHIDTHHAITLRTHDGVAIQLGAMRELDARLPTFDAAWAELTDSERTRIKALHLDGRPDQVTVAFAN
jgi:cell division protein FtsQ